MIDLKVLRIKDSVSSMTLRAYFLRASGYFCDAISLRNQVAHYLENHSANEKDQPYELFAAIPWDQYLTEMPQDASYGDQIT